MEIPDITVYVLYDFDYHTKDGRHVEIKTGERLFLIKKTNNDWWQVIRSSERRPFYVPASYVEEVHKIGSGSYKHENKKQSVPKPRTSLSSSPSDIITCQQQNTKQVTGEKLADTASNLSSYRNRSFSLEDKRVIISSSDKHSLGSVENNTLSSSGYESLCEAVSISGSSNTVIPVSTLQLDNEVDYVNLRRDGDGFVVDDDTSSNETAQTLLKAAADNNTVSNCDDKAVLSGTTADNVNTQGAITGRLNSTKLEIVPCVTGSCYSNIIMCSDNSQKSGGLYGNSHLPLSSSLEELSQQIKVKTDKLRNSSDTGNVICVTDSSTIRHHDSMNNHIIEDKSEVISSESSFVNSIKKHGDIVSDIVDRVKHLNNKSEDSDTSSCKSDVDYKRLQYVGSFKTKQERQKWAKQHFEQCGLRNAVEAEKHKTEQGEQLDSVSDIDTVCDETGGSNVVVSKVSTSTVIEKVRKVEESIQLLEAVQRKDIMELLNKNKGSSHHSLDLIAEDENASNKVEDDELKLSTEKSHHQHVGSDKGSMDSLLDIDKNTGNRKISGGNTSDSIIPTDGEDLYIDNSDSETDSLILGHSRLRSEAVDGRDLHKQKVLLTRNRRVDNKARQYPMQAPPSPTTAQVPSRMLFNGWNEYLTDDNRKFFYNLETKEKSWKPPRRRYNSNSENQANSGSTGNIYSGSSSPLAETDEVLANFQLPAGWRTQVDEETSLPCYINTVTGAKWFSSSDYEGRVYFFEENSNESSWTLPETSQNFNENTGHDGTSTDAIQTLPVAVPQTERNVNRSAKAKSMILADRSEELAPLSQSVPRNWPQLWDGHMCVLKEGTLNRTKITENGKRLRKNWASTHVVLTELFLLFFKDSKTFTAMKSGGGRPELCVDLNGAVIDRGDKVSSRKNVYMISTVLGLQVLIQCDCQSQAEQWLSAIQSAIQNLPSGYDSCRGTRGLLQLDGGTSPDENKKSSRIGRSKSVKNEPAFGCYLEQVCGSEFPRVPVFVQRCIQCIERNVENMKTDGLYRASGNLSQVQKIRLQVDQNNYSVLEQEEDVHVLTSTLKLFFRELKQPLIPFHLFSKALKASTNHNRKEKLKEFREIVKALPMPNHDTLKYLLQHLLRVTKYQEFNRMHIPNLAIVFGPTLMWPEQESLNMAFDLMQQNLVIECFLAEFDHIFR